MSQLLRVLILQSSDPDVYGAMLAETSRANRAYAERRGLDYRDHLGIVRGHLPWHAAYNRIVLLDEIRRSKRGGWILYLDADAYVVDLDFDLATYLSDKGRYALLFAPSRHQPDKWDVNDGVMFVNLDHADTAYFLSGWRDRFEAEVTDEMLRRSDGAWDVHPDDQELIQSIIEKSGFRQASVFIEGAEIFNYHTGTFIRQSIRAHHDGVEDRIAHCRAEVDEALARVGGVDPGPRADDGRTT